MFRRFVLIVALMAAPLNHKLEKHPDLHFEGPNKTEIDGLETLRQRLLLPETLSLPRQNGFYPFEINASDEQKEWALFQE